MNTFDTVDFIFGALSFGAIIASWGLYVYVQYKNRQDFANKAFKEHVQFSLNYVDKNTNTLKIRTLMEMPGTRVFLNRNALDKITYAASKTTEEDAFINLRDDGDQTFMLIAALNSLSSKYSDIFLREAMDLEGGQARKFVFAVTNEKYDRLNITKLRVMVIAEDLLEQFGDPSFVQSLNFEYDVHDVRAKTMAKMAEHYQKGEADGTTKTLYLGL
mmetsp:Transcript_9659/g.12046  ORF Transcript_9659/g.12046 Transcript_9659/m.12046 type:complete len:216 (-) Transcript_9659:195-842(-)|eukprot:CAMPEP_0204838536 /NCGR_PEP_ID=MMETSP1346-20131115/31296_1 /ASSEMBLY_ACC=CAM_ASM_000771 /TAXON_ID=215587 /ORGANISM="Aplanochytrium stocchinoi, Strain GSBS06" /LENGTH=215 /DNA_ID=CAMNT_0051974673 /DNA_START=67 /DNA_END=714 /DNA_ORIENTATION=-